MFDLILFVPKYYWSEQFSSSQYVCHRITRSLYEKMVHIWYGTLMEYFGRKISYVSNLMFFCYPRYFTRFFLLPMQRFLLSLIHPCRGLLSDFPQKVNKTWFNRFQDGGEGLFSLTQDGKTGAYKHNVWNEHFETKLQNIWQKL